MDLRPPRALALAILLWCAPFVFIALRIALDLNHFDSWIIYARAANAWHARRPLYDATIDGFQYLPHATLVFAPFARLGVPLGDIAWRALAWALFGHAVFGAARRLAPERWPVAFLIATIVTLGPSLSSLFTGQANLITAALMLQATVALADQRLWRASLWMAIGFIIKPLMIVLMLLGCLLRPRLAPRLAVAVLLLGALPFAVAPPGYVATQCRAWLAKLAVSSQPDRYFEDLRGLAATLGWPVSHALLRVVRLVAAVAAAALCLVVRRRQPEPAASFFVFALAGVYLMLFNPRTQPNSYVILVPAVALAAALFVLQRRRRPAAAMVAIAASWCGITPYTVLWLRPLTCSIFCVLLVRALWRRSTPVECGAPPY